MKSETGSTETKRRCGNPAVCGEHTIASISGLSQGSPPKDESEWLLILLVQFSRLKTQREFDQTVFMAFRKDDAIEFKLEEYLIELGGKVVLCSNPSENLVARKHNRPGLPKSHHRAPLFSTIFLQHFSTNKSSTDHLKLALTNQISK